MHSFTSLDVGLSQAHGGTQCGKPFMGRKFDIQMVVFKCLIFGTVKIDIMSDIYQVSHPFELKLAQLIKSRHGCMYTALLIIGL